jgi:hypothetical protein
MERMWRAQGIIVPPLYEFRIRSRVFRWYRQLREIEDRASAETAPGLVAELNQLETRVGQITVPLSYADELYALRNPFELVRSKLLRA